MFEKHNQQSNPSGNAEKPAQENPVQEAEPSSRDGKSEQLNRISPFPGSSVKNISDKRDSAIQESDSKPGFKKIWAKVGTFLNFFDDKEEPVPPPPPDKSLKESIQELIERYRDREKRKVMLKQFGKWSWMIFFFGTVFFFLFVLTIWGTIRASDFSRNLLVRFYPPDEVMDYLSAEHESLEAASDRITQLIGENDSIPFDHFDARLIEIVKPVRIYSDEYGIYLMTSKGRYNGEHGIFITKDEEKMPPDLNWGLIEGRIYTYAIYD